MEPRELIRLTELNRWLEHESRSSRRWGYATTFFGLALMLVGGRSFLAQLDEGLPMEKMSFLGQLPGWGLILGVFGLLILVRAPRYHRRLRRIAAEGRKTAMYLSVRIEQDDESRRVIAELRDARNPGRPSPDIEVLLDTPPWPGGEEWLEEQPKDVPVQVQGAQARGPVLIETGRGFLWPSSDLATKYR